MVRRRLVLNSYSDEEEEEEENQPLENEFENQVYIQEPAINNQPANPSSNLPEPVIISDDDQFIDVSDNLSPPSSSPPDPELAPVTRESSTPLTTEPAAAHASRQQSMPVPSESSGCPVGDFLSERGLKLKREWLDSCLRGLGNSVRNLDVAAKAKVCFEHFLISDMNYCGGGILPPNVESMHLVDLPGPFVLQVDEIVNISAPLKERYKDVGAGVKRCLKLSMTDGVQRVFGMEYRHIKDLKVLGPAGLKVSICNVHIRHGLLMLVPETIEVLGGMVEELDAARQRLVNEVNKPPRGKRSRTGVVPSLATRATLAAWPSTTANGPGNTNSSANIPEHNSGSVNVVGHTNGSSNILEHNSGSVNVVGHTNGSSNIPEHNSGSVGCTNNSVNIPEHNSGSVAAFRRANSSILQGATAFHAGVNAATPSAGFGQRNAEDHSFPVSAENTVPNASSHDVSDVEEMHIDAPPVNRENNTSNENFNAISNNNDVPMVDGFEHPLMLSGDREIPFTYLASLSAKWAAMKENAPSVQGKVKCFLTGVKGFQYKKRITYELQVYVDDGSLISEILIDHNVVQKGIGYSPQEVTAALSSSDTKRVSDMKETLRQFQIFLVNFEGIMLVEFNGTSPLPVAFEMNQGCPASDAWLLMRRVKSAAPAQTIDISP